MPTVEGTDDFNHAIDAGFYTAGFFGSPSQVTSPTYNPGPASKSLRIIAAGGNEGVRRSFASPPTLAWVGFPFYFAANPTSADIRVLTISAVSDLAECFLYLNTSGQMYINVGANFSLSSPSLDLSKWHWIEVIFDVSTTTYSATWRIDAADQGNVNSGVLASSSTCDYNQLLTFAGDGLGTWYAGGTWEWGSAANGADWLGEPYPPLGNAALIPPYPQSKFGPF